MNDLSAGVVRTSRVAFCGGYVLSQRFCSGVVLSRSSPMTRMSHSNSQTGIAALAEPAQISRRIVGLVTIAMIYD